MSTESGQTLVVSRILRAPAGRIYKAFIDSEAMVKWMPPHGFTGRVIENSATVGEEYKLEETLADTRVTVRQANMPPEIPLAFATMGWQESFTLLEQLVTPEIPDSPVED